MDLLDVCVVVYLDDVLIFSEDPTTQTGHKQEVFRLRANNLVPKVKVSKCEFGVDTTNFLRFIISPDGLKMHDAKVQIIRE